MHHKKIRDANDGNPYEIMPMTHDLLQEGLDSLH